MSCSSAPGQLLGTALQSSSAAQCGRHAEAWACHRYAWAAISEWQCHQGMTQGGRLSQAPARGGPTPEKQAFRRSRSVACMTQLQAKQKYGSDALSSNSEAPASPERYILLHRHLTRACILQSMHDAAASQADAQLQGTVLQVKGPLCVLHVSLLLKRSRLSWCLAFSGLWASIVLAFKLPCDHSDACLASGLSHKQQVGCRCHENMV